MKILTLWLGAFGFAINKVLWENNPERVFYAFEKNEEVAKEVNETRKHPYFFEWYNLLNNIEIISNYEDIISEVDLLILAIPVQFISSAISDLKGKLKSWVIILNLAKWIDVKSGNTISDLIKEKLEKFEYNYAILSGWMIASEVVEWKQLWADLGIEDKVVWNKIKSYLENNNFKIKLREDILNIELYGSLKNIAAIFVGYYEWKGLEKSTIWYYLVEFYDEMKEIIKLYGWNPNIDFSYYSLGWDIVATCFWNSRNRYFGQLLWKGNSINELLDKLKAENKHAEWYETLKAVYSMVENKDGFENVKFLYGLIK